MAGTIEQYDTKKGPRYRVRYRKPGGAQTDKRGFKTKRDANLYLSSITVNKARGEYLDPTDSKRLVRDIAEQWKRVRLPLLKPSSQNVMETSLRIHVLPEWGKRQVGSIRKTEISAWVNQLHETKAAQTVRRAAFVLSGILEIALDDHAIVRNPAKGVALPSKANSEVAYLTYQQVELFAGKADHPALVRFLAYSGLRWGEAAGLRIKSIDGRKVTVSENAVKVGREYIIGSPKTGERRTVVVPKFIAQEMRVLAAERDADEFLFGDTNPPAYPHATSGWFVKAVREAQWDDPTFPTITPHALRHTAASLAISAGANVKAVQRMLGHASAAMTLDIYADLFDSDLSVVADALEEARADALK